MTHYKFTSLKSGELYLTSFYYAIVTIATGFNLC